MDLGMKIFFSIILTIFLSIAGFYATIITLLMGGQRFLTPLVIIVTIATIVFIILGIFNLIRRRLLLIIVISFYSLSAISYFSYDMYQNYKDNLKILSRQDVDLSIYEPFTENNSLATLDERASLQLTSNLPIIDGATAFYPLYAAFVQAVYPEKEYHYYDSEVMSSQTDGAYWRIAEKTADIIFAFYPSDEQLQRSKNAGYNLQFTPIGKEAFVFFVHTDNPVENLTVEKIQAIYSGEITNWNEVGGNNEPIRAYQRPDNSGSQQALKQVMGDIPLTSPPMDDVVQGMGGIIEQTAEYHNYKNAIGFSFHFFASEVVVNEDIKFLKIDGIYPEQSSIQDNSYPFLHEFYAVTRDIDTNPQVDELVDWILSDQGQELVEKTGYVRIN
ncbi:PstS family phosphate ABC transporter substrate-binding protein [Bacillaceae bacterium W0354]